MNYYKELHSKQFSEEELIKMIDDCEKKHIYKTQKVSMKFIVEYLLNPKYDWCVEDSYICLSDILPHQPHLTYEDYKNYMKSKE
jgi:hypothetical protein